MALAIGTIKRKGLNNIVGIHSEQ